MMPAHQLFKTSFERQPSRHARPVAETTVDLLTERITPDHDTARHIVMILRRGGSPEEINQELKAAGYPVELAAPRSELFKSGATAAAGGDGIIYLNPAAARPGADWNDLLLTIRHELVHLEQMARMPSDAVRKAESDKAELQFKQGGMAGYLSNPHELAAQARTAADLVLNKASMAGVKRMLRTGNLDNWIDRNYQEFRRFDPKVRQRFLKTVYGYLQQELGESRKVRESKEDDLKDDIFRTLSHKIVPDKKGPPSYYEGQKYIWNGIEGSIVRQGGVPHLHIVKPNGHDPDLLELFIEGILSAANLNQFTYTLPHEWNSDDGYNVVQALDALRTKGIISHQGRSGALNTYRHHPDQAHPGGEHRWEPGPEDALDEAEDDIKDEIMGAFDIDSAHVAKQFQSILDRNFGEGFAQVTDYSHPVRLENAHDLNLDFKVDPGAACPGGRRGTKLIRSRGTQVLRAMIKKMGFRMRALHTSISHGDGIDFSAHFGIPDPEIVDQKKRWQRIRRRLGEDEDDIKDWIMSQEPPSDEDFDMFFDSYLETALWSSHGGVDPEHPDGNPKYESLEHFTEDDFDPDSLAELRDNAREFFERTKQYYDTNIRLVRAAHDFWLTRNGHGAGFWDGDWEFEYEPEGIADLGEHLTELSKEFGEVDLEVAVREDGTEYVYVT